MPRTPATAGRIAALVALGTASVLLTGCSSVEVPEVEQVATTFEDAGTDPGTRCELLAPATLVALEEEESAACAEVIDQVPLAGGEIESVEIWGGDAQVRLGGDTLFLTETRAGWRITAASCQPRGEAPYDCELEGP